MFGVAVSVSVVVADVERGEAFQFQYKYKLGLIKWHSVGSFEMILMNTNMSLNF